jgi:hypothetical protein
MCPQGELDLVFLSGSRPGSRTTIPLPPGVSRTMGHGIRRAHFYAALHQLDPAVRSTFLVRVAAIIGAHPAPGPGDVDRAIRAALVGLWTPPPDKLGQLEGRWARRGGGIRRAAPD